MTWAVRHGDGPTGILDLPLSIAAMVCDTAGCGWDMLDPETNPGHLAAVLAGVRSFATGSPFDDELVKVAALPLGDALGHLAHDPSGGADGGQEE